MPSRHSDRGRALRAANEKAPPSDMYNAVTAALEEKLSPEELYPAALNSKQPQLQGMWNMLARNALAQTAGFAGDIDEIGFLLSSNLPGGKENIGGISSGLPNSEEMAEILGGNSGDPSWPIASVIAPGPGEILAGAKVVGKALLAGMKGIGEVAPGAAVAAGKLIGRPAKPTTSGVDDQGRIVAKTIGTQDDFQVKQQRYLVEQMRTEVAERKKYGEPFKTAEKNLGVEERRLAKMEANSDRTAALGSGQEPGVATKSMRLKISGPSPGTISRVWGTSDAVPESSGRWVDLVINPDAAAVKSAFGGKEVRFMTDDLGNLYVWPSRQGFHDEVIDALGIDRSELQVFSDDTPLGSELFNRLNEVQHEMPVQVLGLGSPQKPTTSGK